MSTGGRDLRVAGDATFRSPLGRAATGPPGLPSGSCIVQELDLRRVEFAAAAFAPPGVDAHSGSSLTRRGSGRRVSRLGTGLRHDAVLLRTGAVFADVVTV